MFKKMGLKAKMLAVFGSLSLTVLVVGGIGAWSLREVSNDYMQVTDMNMPKIYHSAQMRDLANATRMYSNILGLPVNSADDVKKFTGRLNETLVKYDEAQNEFLKYKMTSDEGLIFEKVSVSWTSFSANVKKLMDLASSNTPQDKEKFYSLVVGDFRKTASDFQTNINTLIEYQNTDARKWVSAAQGSTTKSHLISGLVVGVAFLCIFTFGFFYSRTLAQQLTDIAKGLSLGATELNTATKKISTSSIELSESSTEQASALQETVASLEEVSAMVGKNADNARSSQEYAKKSQNTVVNGRTTVDEMIKAMKDINLSNDDIMRQIEHSNQEISEIVKVISEIGNKTKVINDIVFQTKLLSFNASVEAARAGEHGRGFAVVAEEVGNLAQMSGNAAKEISGLLDGSISKVESIVDQTKTQVEKLIIIGKEKVSTGTQKANKCGEVLDEILSSVNQVNQMVTEIASASKEQAQGVQEINKAMSALDQVTQQNTSVSQESAASAELLSNQTVNLKKMVDQLTSTVQGHGVAAPKITLPAPKIKKENVQPNVLPMVKKTEPVKPQALPASRTVSGGAPVPSANDPRFEDV